MLTCQPNIKNLRRSEFNTSSNQFHFDNALFKQLLDLDDRDIDKQSFPEDYLND